MDVEYRSYLMGSVGRNDRPGVLKPRSTVEGGGEGQAN